jgi:hypothetical protein
MENWKEGGRETGCNGRRGSLTSSNAAMNRMHVIYDSHRVCVRVDFSSNIIKGLYSSFHLRDSQCLSVHFAENEILYTSSKSNHNTSDAHQQ